LPTTLQRVNLPVVQTPRGRPFQKPRHVFDIVSVSASDEMHVVGHDGTRMHVQPEFSYSLTKTIADGAPLQRRKLNRWILEVFVSLPTEAIGRVRGRPTIGASRLWSRRQKVEDGEPRLRSTTIREDRWGAKTHTPRR